eukprot:g5715.t1
MSLQVYGLLFFLGVVGGCFLQPGVNYTGTELARLRASSVSSCCAACGARSDCYAFTFSGGVCVLRRLSGTTRPCAAGAVCGSGYAMGSDRYFVPIDATSAAAAAAAPVRLGSFVWYNYYGYSPPGLFSHYPASIARLTAPPPPREAPCAPASANASTMAAFVASLYPERFLAGARNQSDWLSALGVNDHTVLISWGPPGAYVDAAGTAPELKAAEVHSYASYLAATVQLLRRSGVRFARLELSNEPDGDWNCRIPPRRYAALLAATRRALDALDQPARGVGLVGPGLYVLSEDGRFWPGAGLSSADYMAAIAANADAVAALDAVSTHVYDDVLVPRSNLSFVGAQLQRFNDVLRGNGSAALAAKPRVATEWGVATSFVGGAEYAHTVKDDCYETAGAGPAALWPDAEGRAPAYAVRSLATMLLLFSAGFADAQAWELADVSGIGKPDVGCWGWFGRAGELKPAGAALHALLARLGAAPRALPRTWADGEVVVGAFVAAPVRPGSAAGVGVGASAGAEEALVVVAVNAGTTTEMKELVLLGPLGAALLRHGPGMASGYNCNATDAVKYVWRAAENDTRVDITLPPASVVVLSAPGTAAPRR